MPMICSSVNRFFIAVPLWNGLYTVTVLNAGSRSKWTSPIGCLSPAIGVAEARLWFAGGHQSRNGNPRWQPPTAILPPALLDVDRDQPCLALTIW